MTACENQEHKPRLHENRIHPFPQPCGMPLALLYAAVHVVASSPDPRGYSGAMTDTSELDDQVSTARTAFDAAYANLVAVAGGIYANGEAAAEQIFGIAEEFGASKATTAMLGKVDQFGELAERATDAVVADTADHLEAALEHVLSAQDDLDLATAAREHVKRAANPARQQHITIHGRDYVIDSQRGELRSADNPAERYQLADQPVQARAANAPSLTEQVAREHAVPAAQPSKDRSRTRER